MRRLLKGVLLSALPMLALSLVLAGCGSKDTGTSTTTNTPENKGKKGGAGETGTKAAKGPLTPVEAKGTTTLKGKITLTGNMPDLKALNAALEEQMNKNQDKALCHMGTPAEVTEQSYRIGDNKGVGNVFVWIEPEAGHYFPISPEQLKEAKDHPATLDQPHCAFIPHCFVLFTGYIADPKNPRKPKPTGQKLIIKNSANTTHNTKWEGDINEPKGNEIIQAGKEITIDKLVPSKDPITFNCNIHGWMSAYARNFDHPYATVSKAADKSDDPAYGTYEIKNVPAGVKVNVIAWHEKAGYLTPPKGVPLDLKEGETTKDFEMTAK
jgi:hypothetical protein